MGTFLQLMALPLAGVLSPFYAVWVVLRGRDGWVRHIAVRRLPISPRRLFALLNPADPDNRWRQRGWHMSPIADEPGQFRLTDPRLPEEPWRITITQTAPGMVIAFSARREVPPPGAAIVGSVSRYDFEPRAEGVRLTQQEFTQFRAGLPLLSFAFHELVMRCAIAIDLSRLTREVGTPGPTSAEPGQTAVP